MGGKTANAHRGEVTLELGGRDIRLVPSFKNLAEIESITGDGVLAVARRLGEGEVRLTDIVAILTATSDPSLDEDEAATAIEEVGLMQVLEPLGVFMVAALTGGEAGNARKGKGRTARSRTRTVAKGRR